jgi:mRNA interferase YafQ
MEKLAEVIDILRSRGQFTARHRDHGLRGEWKGFRDVHVAPDWILIYQADNDVVYLVRTGTHADIFKT